MILNTKEKKGKEEGMITNDIFHINEDKWYSVHDDLNFEDVFTYKKIKTNKQITYYNDVIAFDIETSSFKEENYEYDYRDDELYSYLRGIKIKIPQTIYHDLPDFNDIRKQLFGRIYFSKSEGISIDSLYHELISRFPWYFDEDLYNPADELEKIIEVFYENAPVEETDDDKRCIMYVWQIAINGTVIIGRTWNEFLELCNQISNYFELSEDKRMIFFVHNLSFEMQWLLNLFKWKKVFAIASRKPIYALTETGIEFRCSYILSNLSLYNVGESLHKYKVSKAVGDLNYDRIRHFKTPLQKQEYHYIINDVLVVSAFIKEAIEDAGDITKLPLTATGYCRNYVRKVCLVGDNKAVQFNKYHEMIKTITISGVEEYDQMTRAFQGGFTHTGVLHSGKLLYEVASFDLCSAYPSALCLYRDFPMSKGKIVKPTSYEELKEYCDLYCCIFDIKFKKIRPKYINENYISCSKCFKKGLSYKNWVKIHNIVSNNGRLVSGDNGIEMTITNIDFEIIEKTYEYNWNDIQLGTFRIYKRGYLPRELIMAILHLYKNKTELKGVKGKEDFYQKSKQLLNACYGMMVTSIIMPVHGYDNDHGWTIEHKDKEKAIKSYNKSKKRFNFYGWGIFCTAIIRRVIFNTIIAMGDDYCYSDTDSVKVLHGDKHIGYIESYNKSVEARIREISKFYDIPEEYFKPKTIKCTVKTIGIFENDENYKMFKALRAKAYMYIKEDGKLSMTVSGVNKKTAVPYLLEKYGKYKAFKYFNDDLKIPAEYTGKLTHYYLDDPMEGEITDYLGNTVHYRTESGIYLEKTSYNFTLQAEYLDYLKQVQGVLI